MPQFLPLISTKSSFVSEKTSLYSGSILNKYYTANYLFEQE
ncbi:hypothetical protein HMPREF0322_04824 [Desulfitobacterium hafniense DP7]|uniref:Uncharacterized protein n=1 Tax=Desulfitobacterium hafniense DP7 TaxID=537010 RepID=G9XV12_DESHA|nr:hypothetical protein HMPREF0322_04824 [Desulfitobacterium hafniense DP7]